MCKRCVANCAFLPKASVEISQSKTLLDRATNVGSTKDSEPVHPSVVDEKRVGSSFHDLALHIPNLHVLLLKTHGVHVHISHIKIQ